MQALLPYQNFYMSGTDGRAGRYTSDAGRRIDDVHPEDVEALEKQGCKVIEGDLAQADIDD